MKLFTPETSKHFKKIIDPSSTEYYVLTTKIAPVQQSFYFVNKSMTDDGRYLWFTCTFPPSSTKILAFIDFSTDEINILHETAGCGSSTLLDVSNGDIYFGNGNAFYKRDNQTGNYIKISDAPEKLTGIPPCRASSTHLTFSPDKTELFVDMRNAGNGSRLGSINIETGEYSEWFHSDYYLYNHAQFNPANKNLALMAGEHWVDVNTGESHRVLTDSEGVYCRLWTLERNGNTKRWRPMDSYATHEWWSADGRKLYYIDSKNGIVAIDIETDKYELILKDTPWHGESSADDKYFVYDKHLAGFYRGTPSQVIFYNYETKKSVLVVTKNPAANPPEKPNLFHMDPHPQFVGKDKYIVFTCTTNGGIDLAIAATNPLIEKTK